MKVLIVLVVCVLSTLARPSQKNGEPADDFPAMPPILHAGYFSPDYKGNMICEL